MQALGRHHQHSAVRGFAQGARGAAAVTRVLLHEQSGAWQVARVCVRCGSGFMANLPPLQFPLHNSGSLTGSSGLVYAIAGPGEDRLRYKLTSSRTSPLSFGETWFETPAMAFPRASPVVSVALSTGRKGIGHKMVVAGGVPEFEAEHLAVEVFDSETDAWEVYGDLPEDFSKSRSRSWMSGVVCDNKFYMTLIHS